MEVEVDPTADAVEEGNYEVIRRRLVGSGEELRGKAEALNGQRTAVFGSSELVVAASARVRTDHNCVPRDIVQVRGHLLFGYNVRVGLKQEMSVSDVFSLHTFAETADGVDFPGSSLSEAADGFLGEERFTKDFVETYKYYRETRLRQLRVVGGKLLAVFQYGDSDRDIRVFRWTIQPDGSLAYVDNRGERDHVFPASHGFEWRATTRDDHVEGRHPHVAILDEVFVETVGGDLTVKVENNTDDGRGVYSEPVDDPKQTLDDGRIEYAKLGGLILLRIRPYGEEVWRHLVFNTRTKEVVRIDAIGASCLALPEDHGIIFPGGYYLETGDHKLFGGEHKGLVFNEMVRSPNGEDVLFVFYEPASGHYLLLPYNLIRKEVQAQIVCHGYSVFEDGRVVVFRAATDDPVRVHPMQVWATPFTSLEHAETGPKDDSFLARVGNAELVRGISEALSIVRMIENTEPTRRLYEDLIAAVRRTVDGFYWLDSSEVGDVKSTLEKVRSNAELIVDEFEKVVALRRQADQALGEADARHRELMNSVLPGSLDSVDAFMGAMADLRTHRGHLITLRDVRYMDLEKVDGLEEENVGRFDEVSQACVGFMSSAESLRPLEQKLDEQLAAIEGIAKTSEAKAIGEEIDRVGFGLEVLSEVIAGIEVDDPTQRTAILEGVSEVFAHVNRVRATLETRRRAIASHEGRAEFAAQFTLFAQSVTSALSLADTPEKCDEQLSRLLLSLEELEGRFSEFDDYLTDLAAKRDEVYDAFDAKKQTLLDQRQRRVANLIAAAGRILGGVKRRATTLGDIDALNAYFAADAMVLKLRQVAEQLAELGDSVKADELIARLKSEKQDALRGLRDRADLFEEGAQVIRLGRHRFSVNTQPLELTMVPYEGGMALHLAGTDFFDPVAADAFGDSREFWSQQLVSETDDVYRSEYLAATILFDAQEHRNELSLQKLRESALQEDGVLALVREAAAARYDEGYERGVHDGDAARILERLLQLHASAGLLRFAPEARALACLFWACEAGSPDRDAWLRRGRSVGRVRAAFTHTPAAVELADDIGPALRDFGERIGWSSGLAPEAARYLVEELATDHPRFVTSADAVTLRDALVRRLEDQGARREFDEDLRALGDRVQDRLDIATAWVRGLVANDESLASSAPALLEAAVLVVSEGAMERATSSAQLAVTVDGLLGQHRRVRDGRLELRLDAFLSRVGAFARERVPAFRAYREQRQRFVEDQRERLRLEEFKPRVMSAFVRNKLINDVYLPLIGDNLAKQTGALGEGKRTDLMGMLLLISPPGYGKTTLMEYVASRLGLVFMKVNGPSLGHEVTSLDPSEAPNATARQEVEKVNLALEMGNNVMLYLDDIQHTSPELLQKFISLCDATRKIEGVWKGRTRTYDLRGKKFCVVMAGNPYTEAGEMFRIPDMLANRADVYNLGDVLSGREEQFALSFVENALTSNGALAQMTSRGMEDVYHVIDMARGKEVPTSDLKHNYSAVELDEMKKVLAHLFAAREVLLRVNVEYIRSAAQSDADRTEPRFQLQGSYRNMNKIAEKLVSAMTADEVDDVIDDHYNGEAQTLTTGAESNLLKLAELRGTLTEEQDARWAQIKDGVSRRRLMGGDEDDPMTRVTGTLAGLAQGLQGIEKTLVHAADDAREARVVEVAQRAQEAERAAEVQAAATKEAPWVDPLMAKLDTLATGLARPAPDPARSIAPILRQMDQRLAAAYENQKSHDGSAALAPALERLAKSLAQQVTPQQSTEEASSSVAALVPVLAKLNATMEANLQVSRAAAAKGAAEPPPLPAAARARAGAGGAPAGLSVATEEAIASMLARLDATLRLVSKQQSQLGQLATRMQSQAPAAAPRPAAGEKGLPAPAAASAVLSTGGWDQDAERLLGQQVAIFERTMVPLIQTATRQMDEGRAVNARMVELLDVLKLFMQHLHRLKRGE